VKEISDRLHKHIAIDVLTQVPLSNNLNFGNITPKLKDTKAKAKAQILGRRCVAQECRNQLF
jgi:hypothetical protein